MAVNVNYTFGHTLTLNSTTALVRSLLQVSPLTKIRNPEPRILHPTTLLAILEGVERLARVLYCFTKLDLFTAFPTSGSPPCCHAIAIASELRVFRHSGSRGISDVCTGATASSTPLVLTAASLCADVVADVNHPPPPPAPSCVHMHVSSLILACRRCVVAAVRGPTAGVVEGDLRSSFVG